MFSLRIVAVAAAFIAAQSVSAADLALPDHSDEQATNHRLQHPGHEASRPAEDDSLYHQFLHWLSRR
jgi:hypothetical protein